MDSWLTCYPATAFIILWSKNKLKKNKWLWASVLLLDFISTSCVCIMTGRDRMKERILYSNNVEDQCRIATSHRFNDLLNWMKCTEGNTSITEMTSHWLREKISVLTYVHIKTTKRHKTLIQIAYYKITAPNSSQSAAADSLSSEFTLSHISTFINCVVGPFAFMEKTKICYVWKLP